MADVRETTNERVPLMKDVKEDTSTAAVEMQEIARDGLDLRYTEAGDEPKVRFRPFNPREKPPEGSEIEVPTSLDYGDDETESSDDEIQYCDCIAVALKKSLPGVPGKKGKYYSQTLQRVIPYVSIYDTQEQARHRGYWIPGVPVNARITKVERDTTSRFHLINSLLYTIELEHGDFRWQVVRNYNDFQMLNNRLRLHRTREQIMAPIRRTRDRVDSYLESWGVDVIPDHKEDCPYYTHPGQIPKKKSRQYHHKYQILKREADAFEANGNQAPLATVDSPLYDDDPISRETSVQQAVMSGILEAPEGAAGPRSHETATVDSETGEPSPRRSRRKRTRQKHRLPPFPMKPDSLVTNLEERREQLENWLQMFLHIPINRNHHETAEFLEVSRYSFVNDLGGKHTEGFIKKQPGGLRNFVTCKQFCVRYLVPWGKRWLMVRDSFVAYMDPKTERIRLVMLMDWRFSVEAGAKETEDGIPTGLTIHNAQT
ncbi:hypothetical protein WR25_02847 [Diploscapter pachys]|uniref:PX domain-containing protein n=1 Tax=Diploscapter pachys TaxID=2018661 RepID=A0A2A2KPX5_9BILA|nr:hypothetical protein WR25_02847 [Diploscapter pachys]